MGNKLVLPINGDAAPSRLDALRQSISDCEPASFGLRDKDVIDPQYHKTVKLDPEQFATSFHPADYRIVEYIERVLLPSISDEKQNKLQLRNVHAELYKLNVSQSVLSRLVGVVS